MASIPYYADLETLPSALPTSEEIDSSQDIIINHTARRVVCVKKHFIVKYGTAVDLLEGQNMLYIRESTEIRVPRIYALYMDSLSKKNYIVMERVCGEQLASVWPSLSDAEKEIISTQLRTAMDELRRLPSPGGYCSLYKQPLQDVMFWNGDEKDVARLSGPFETESELNSALIQKYVFNNLPKEKAGFYKRTLDHVLRNHPPTFTHGDLQRKNILVSRQFMAKQDDGALAVDSLSITLLDWEVAGWYPSYWEYSRAMLGCGRWNDDWHACIGKVLYEYLPEWAWMDMMFKELWS